MAITAQAGYKIDPNNPNAVVKIDSTAMPGSVSAIQQSNQQPSMAFGAVNTSNPTPIPVSTVTSNQTPISVPNPNVDYFNNIASSAITGAALPPVTPEPTQTTTTTAKAPELSSFQNLLSKYLPSNFSLTAPTSTVDQYKQMQAENDIAGKTKEVNDLSSQLAEIKTKYDLTPIVMEKAAQGNITTDILNRSSAARQRDYAIEALPVTAALNAAQGRLDSANKNIQTLIGLIQTDQENTYKYQSDVLSRAMEFASNDQKVELQKRQEAIDAQKANQTQFNSVKDGYINAAIQAGDYATAGKMASTTDQAVLSSLVGQIKSANPNLQITESGGGIYAIDKSTGAIKTLKAPTQQAQTSGGVLASLPTSVQTKLISIANDFGSTDIVKRFNATADGLNLVNGISADSKNPSDHQTIVYAFAKSLDPDSVVREGEYATIKKYAQSTISAYGKEITNALNGTGFLSQKAIENIKSAMTNNYQSRKPAYDNLFTEKSRIINNIAGTDVAKDVLIDYSKSTTPTQTSKYDSYANDITPSGTNALMPRSVWSKVTDKDGLLAYVKSLGFDLKITD